MSASQPLLSVCVMTYNRLPTLKAALRSILQDIEHDPRAELLICDNASTDGTQVYCAAFLAEHPGVRYYRSPSNGGFDGNVLNCIAQARGRFVGFFSDDDVARPGAFRRILDELARADPAVLCINHYSFKGSDPEAGDPWEMPVRDETFEDGRAFFAFAGLGFLSSLTLRTELARKYVGDAKIGSGQAHLDVASRICLRERAPFVFVGTVAAAATVWPTYRSDWLRGCAVEETRFYQGLARDGLLEKDFVTSRVRSFIPRRLFGLVISSKCLGDNRELRTMHGRLVEVYGRYLLFWLLIAPVLVIPRPILRPPYLLARSIIGRFRPLRYR